MYVEAVLALIVVVAIIRRIVVVMMVVAVMMLAVMNVTILVLPVDVEENARVHAGRRRKGHAHRGCDGKHEHHRPNEGDFASACSSQSRQHAFR